MILCLLDCQALCKDLSKEQALRLTLENFQFVGRLGWRETLIDDSDSNLFKTPFRRFHIPTEEYLGLFLLSSSSKMDKLPYELLSVIFALLSKEDVINLPTTITFKGLTDREASSMFHTIDVYLDQRSLRSFIRAGQHPFIYTRVMRLQFHGDYLARLGARKFQGFHNKNYEVDAFALDEASRESAAGFPESLSR